MVTLDQLQVLAAVADEGSFSAAARKLRRVQSAVSTAIANLEGQLGLPLFDRRERVPRLTDAGKAVLASARRVLGDVDALHTLATGLTSGLEPIVSLCVDAVFPTDALVAMCKGFARAFPAVELRVDVQTMSAVAASVLDGSATLGVASSVAAGPQLERHALTPIRMIPVVAAGHPLASMRGALADATLAEHVQIVLSERGGAGLPDQGVLSPRTWRVHDLSTKHALLRAGLGWGNLPVHLVRRDLARRTLVRLRPAAWADDEHTLHLALVHRRDMPLGPAHRWVADQLANLCALEVTGKPRARGRGAP